MLEGTDPDQTPAPGAWRTILIDLARGVRFFSRLRVPRLPFEADPHAAPDMQGIVRVMPFVGIIIAALPALMLIAALHLNLGPWLAAMLAIAAMTVLTGVLHEDGLADLADSFGGQTRERKLAIMKDSLIGSYGTSALILTFALRIGTLATLGWHLEPGSTALAFLAAAALSRTAALTPLTFLPPARSSGASHAAGRPTPDSFWISCALTLIAAVGLGLVGGLPRFGIALMLMGAALAGWLMTRLSNRLIQGQTGDVAGATQQVAEITVMLALLIGVAP